MEMIVLSNMKKTAAVGLKAQKNVTSPKLVIFSTALVAVVIAIMMLKRGYLSTVLAFYNYVLPVLIPVFALTTVAAITLMVVRKHRGIDESGCVWSSSLMLILSAGLLAICLSYTTFSATRLLVSVLAFAALYYVYHLYSRAFFVYSLMTVCGGFLLSLERFFGLVGTIVLAVLVAAVIAVVLMILLAPKSALGRWASVADDSRYPFYITAAILLVGLALLLLLPAWLFYAVAVLFGSYLVIAIINTLKMM